MLAGAADANRYLDQTKIRFASDDDASDEIIAADRHIAAALFDVFGDVVYTWALNPQSPQVEPPEIVTEYAAMYMAALRYAKSYSEETLGENEWAAQLFERVDMWLTQLSEGTATIEGLESGIAFNEDNFYPNSTAVIEGTDISDRKFTMDQVL